MPEKLLLLHLYINSLLYLHCSDHVHQIRNIMTIQPKHKNVYLIVMFHSPTANFIRHVVMGHWWWTRDQNMVIGMPKAPPFLSMQLTSQWILS